MDWPVLGELESLPEASSRPDDVSKILQQLRLVVDPIIYGVVYPFIHPRWVARFLFKHHDNVGMFFCWKDRSPASFLLPDFIIPKEAIKIFQPNRFWGGKFATSWVGSGSVFVLCAKLFVGSWELANWFKYVQKADKLGFNPVHGTCKPTWGIWKWL